MTPTLSDIIIHIVEIRFFTSKLGLEALRESWPLVRVGWRRINARSNAAFAEMLRHSAKHVHELMDAGLGIILFLLQPGSFSNPHGATLSIECSVLRTALTAPTHRVQSMGVCTFYLCLLGTGHDRDPVAGVLAVPVVRDQIFDLLYCSWVTIDRSFFEVRWNQTLNVSSQSYHLDKRVVPVRFGGKASKWFKALSCTEQRQAQRLAPR